MKTKLFFLAVACLLLFASNGQAQIRVSEQVGMEQPSMSPERQQFEQDLQKATMKGVFRGVWNGRGSSLVTTVIEITMRGDDPEVVNKVLGISKEQEEQLNNHMQSSMENIQEAFMKDAEMVKFIEVMQTLHDDKMPDADTAEKILETVEKITEMAGSLMSDAIDNALNEVLPPEQLQRINEILLANIEEMSFVSPDLFEILDLTDAQKQQMETIKKELEPEFEKTLDNWVNGIMTSPELKEDNPERKKIFDEIQSKGKAFATKFRTQMFDVLTDEQWERLVKLIDDPPEHALLFRKAWKKQSGEGEESKEPKKADVWVPGPNSWQPGDAIPEAYRIERNERRNFPRPKQPSPALSD